MEQNTEASQAVDDTVERGKFVTEYLRYMAKEAPQSHPEIVYSMAHTRWGGIAGVMWRAGRAALKAQPAPTIAAKPVKYEQRFVSPQGIATVWHDAQSETFHRHRSNGDLGDGWIHEVRALYAGPPAPTEAPKGPLEIPEPGSSNSLADRIFRLPCNWKGDHRLSAAIEMGHAMACEQAYDLAYEHAAQSPTEAAHGALSTNLNLTTSDPTCQPSEAQGNTSNNSSSSQLSGNSGELANKQVLENIEQVQGEDSARLDAEPGPWVVLVEDAAIDYMRLLDVILSNGVCLMGRKWGALDWTQVRDWRYSRARASAETGGVKS